MIDYIKINNLIENKFMKKSGWIFGRGLSCEEQIGLFNKSLFFENVNEANVLFLIGYLDSEVKSVISKVSSEKLKDKILFLIGNKACGNSLFQSHDTLNDQPDVFSEQMKSAIRINDFKIREGRLEELVMNHLEKEFH